MNRERAPNGDHQAVHDCERRLGAFPFAILGERHPHAAQRFFKRFNDAFWDEELGFYAFALDGEKKKVLTVASNPGHCLWSGIVPPERAAKVVRRLMAPDMWSGWGIRTLSALHPSFNPYNYQTGSFWPHDNAIIALGFKRYGFGAEAARIARDISDAGSHFLSNQLPELYTTIERDEEIADAAENSLQPVAGGLRFRAQFLFAPRGLTA